MDTTQVVVPSPPIDDSQSDTALVSAKHLGEVTKEITRGFVDSLRDLQSLDPNSGCSLVLPAKILLYLGTFLIFTSFALRCIPYFLNFYQFGDFIASVSAGSVLVAGSVLLFCVQYRTEKAGGTETVKAAERVVAGGLRATLGPTQQSPPSASQSSAMGPKTFGL